VPSALASAKPENSSPQDGAPANWERRRAPVSGTWRLPLFDRDGCGLTRTLVSTDMPGPIATSVGGLSMTILTGTRCTILTQLPVAFLTGGSENAVPDPGCTLATWPRIVRSG
jgi:hypothetical protein